MLREADIGVGLFGKEGRQAVMASDYAIAQFRFLGPLMLFHGRESYHRIVFLLLYSFYKGIQFAMLSFWFALFNLFSGQTLFESWHFGLYHVLFTSLPILVFAVTNRDAGPRSSGRLFPKLYGRDTFSVAALAAWLVRGVVDSAAIFFVCVFAFGEGSVGPSTGWCYGLFSTGIACLTASIVVVNAKLAMGVTWWTWPMLGSLVLTVAVWFGFTMLVAVTSNSGADWSMFYVSVNVMVLPVFWLAVLLAFSLCMFYELLIWRLGFYLWPSDSDVVRRLQKGASDTWTE
jgi:phospholipid-transporting ATPase